MACLLGFSAWLLFVRPEIEFQRVVRKYPPGTPAEKILNDYGGKITLERTGNVLPYEPREDERTRYTFYFLRLPSANAELDFNYYQQLIRVNRISALRKPR